MVTNIIIACDCCGTTFRLRWQVEDTKAPVLIRCPKCNTKIKGVLQFGDNLKLSRTFNNTHVVKEKSEDTVHVANVTHTANVEQAAEYVQEISAEFITHKLKPASEFNDFTTPFIRCGYLADSADFSEYRNALLYLHFIEKYPNEAERLYDLLKAKSRSYLKELLKNEKNPYIAKCKQAIKKYRLNSDVDILMASHQYIVAMLLGSGLERGESSFPQGTNGSANSSTNSNTNGGIFSVMMELLELVKKSPDQVKEFSRLLDNQGYYGGLNKKFPALAGLYNENYPSLISTLMLDGIENIDLDEWGLSSVDYVDLLELYRKCYEFIGEFIIYIIGLNNIYERGGYNNFKNGASDIETKVNQEDKYNRIQSFVKEGERYSAGYCATLNKIIRNAEAHFDVEYDVFTQKIKFINHGKKSTETMEIYLLQFAAETIKVFKLAVKLWEIAYQLQKNRMICDLHMEWNYGRG